MSDLVAILRMMAAQTIGVTLDPLEEAALKAADRIAALEAENARLREAERTAWERGRDAAAAFVGKCDWESHWILDHQLVEPCELAEAIRALTPETSHD